jgi:hypothetical protein
MNTKRKEHPHKSTTNREAFFHIRDENDCMFATVFFREEQKTDGTKQWEASASLCHENDQFSREVGRNVARRKYFQGDRVDAVLDGAVPTYEDAEIVLYAHYVDLGAVH